MHSNQREDMGSTQSPLWSEAAVVDDELHCTVTCFADTPTIHWHGAVADLNPGDPAEWRNPLPASPVDHAHSADAVLDPTVA